ncbi:MAG TPA: response regulator [Candidatus Dormibacteraeota bacterium]|jgi:two-component system phosphate regulon response regulator PhoB
MAGLDGETRQGVGPFVVLVEDDPSQADMYRRGLEARGFRVEVFPDASAMFERLETNVPDVAVLDWRFAGTLTGVEIIENMRLDERLVNVPVIMLSNYAGEADGAVGRALEAGAREWLVKSRTTPETLAHRIQDALGLDGAATAMAMGLKETSPSLEGQHPRLADAPGT